MWDGIQCGLLAAGVVLLIIPLVLKVCSRTSLFARAADLHHTHKTPVPRLGGLALAISFVALEIFISVRHPEQRAGNTSLVIILSSLAMFGLGFCDDLLKLRARHKFIGQILIAWAVCYCGIGIQRFQVPWTGHLVELDRWGILITVFWLVGMTNLINLIDGVDGLAGGISMMLMVLLAYTSGDNVHFALLASGMAGALLSFLFFNFPPARIYLGDGGAYFLGFQIGLFSIMNSHKGTVVAALIAPLLVLALPILDTSLAIARRSLQGLPIFRPDRKHLHHRLLGMGVSRRKAVLLFYWITLIFLLMGLAVYWSRDRWVPPFLGLASLLLLLLSGKLNFRRDWIDVGRVVGNSLGMRQEVHYALSLIGWLDLEGGRCDSVDNLWSDLTFAARKLGFTSVKLILADGERVWGDANKDAAGRKEPPAPVGKNGTRDWQFARHEIPGMGILELKAPRQFSNQAGAEQPEHDADVPFCPRISDPGLFEVLSELLAEGWFKAATRFANGNASPMRFSSRPSSSREKQGRQSHLTQAAPAQISPPVVNQPASGASVIG